MGTPNPTPARQKFATNRGLVNVDLIAQASVETRLAFHLACAVVEMESGGKNIYGHDRGGALSTNGRSVAVCGELYQPGSDVPVTPANAGVFLIMIGAGARSNGMGPCQITYAGELPDGRSGGLFRQMLEDELLPWVPLDNMIKGFGDLKKILDAYDGSVEKAGTVYNHGNLRDGITQYGRDLASLDRIYRKGFGLKC